MFTKEQENKIVGLFGRPITNHTIGIFIPKKHKKYDLKDWSVNAFDLFVRAFGGAEVRDYNAAYLVGNKIIREDCDLISAEFSDQNGNHMNSLNDVYKFCQALIFVVSFNERFDGLLLKIDDRLFWVKAP